MHARIGYRDEEGWNQSSMFELQIALDEIEKFQEIFYYNFISIWWEQ